MWRRNRSCFAARIDDDVQWERDIGFCLCNIRQDVVLCRVAASYGTGQCVCDVDAVLWIAPPLVPPWLRPARTMFGIIGTACTCAEVCAGGPNKSAMGESFQGLGGRSGLRIPDHRFNHNGLRSTSTCDRAQKGGSKSSRHRERSRWRLDFESRLHPIACRWARQSITVHPHRRSGIRSPDRPPRPLKRLSHRRLVWPTGANLIARTRCSYDADHRPRPSRNDAGTSGGAIHNTASTSRAHCPVPYDAATLQRKTSRRMLHKSNIRSH